ncbi:MAG: methyltransferase domain-containing protein [Hyphomonadaceae bacterium]
MSSKSTPPQTQPAIFDGRLARLHRARAAKGFAENAFLHRRVAEDLAERLEAVPRRFERALLLGAPALMQESLRARPALAARIGEIVKADPAAALADGGIVLADETLPFTAAEFDLVLSPLILHGVNDLPGALIQIRRALRPDGLFLGALYAGGALQELRAALLEGESEVKGGAGPRVAPFGDLIDLAGLLQRASFALPAADRDEIVVRYREPLRLLADLRAAGDTSALVARAPPLTRAVLMRALEFYRERFAEADGRVRATFEIVTLTGWAPHESQQKPLRPGSAKARLADALHTVEKKVPR